MRDRRLGLNLHLYGSISAIPTVESERKECSCENRRVLQHQFSLDAWLLRDERSARGGQTFHRFRCHAQRSGQAGEVDLIRLRRCRREIRCGNTVLPDTRSILLLQLAGRRSQSISRSQKTRTACASSSRNSFQSQHLPLQIVLARQPWRDSHQLQGKQKKQQHRQQDRPWSVAYGLYAQGNSLTERSYSSRSRRTLREYQYCNHQTRTFSLHLKELRYQVRAKTVNATN